MDLEDILVGLVILLFLMIISVGCFQCAGKLDCAAECAVKGYPKSEYGFFLSDTCGCLDANPVDRNEHKVKVEL